MKSVQQLCAVLPEKVSQIFPLLLEDGDIEHLFHALTRPKPSPRAGADTMDLDAPVSKEPASAQYPVISKLARTDAYNTLLEAHIADWEEEGTLTSFSSPLLCISFLTDSQALSCCRWLSLNASLVMMPLISWRWCCALPAQSDSRKCVLAVPRKARTPTTSRSTRRSTCKVMRAGEATQLPHVVRTTGWMSPLSRRPARLADCGRACCALRVRVPVFRLVDERWPPALCHVVQAATCLACPPPKSSSGRCRR